MKIFNTKTRKKEEFKPLKSDKIKIYYCGPTVYNYAHIGNLKTYTFEDMVVRTLRFLGENVETTMNITDVDDKTIRDSIKAGVKLSDFTKKYTEIFLDDIKKLNIIPADNIIPVTDLIPEMLRMINTMLRRGHAYLGEDNSIYFKVSSFKDYGKFANLDLDNLKDGVRIDNDEYDKESFGDFVLWKSYKSEDGDNFWEEEFEVPQPKPLPKGEEITTKKVVIKGRPGWHIECSACNMKVFGPQIDIHMGGEDLIFPHHQNEIAQTESCTRKEFSKYWMHSGHLLSEGKKMAKSAGNFYTLKDLEDKFLADLRNPSILYRAIRLSFISGKYREQIDFSLDKVKSNISSIKKIDETIKNILLEIEDGDKDFSGVTKEFSEQLQEFLQEFIENLEDDFNTPEALAVFFSFNKFVNSSLRENNFSLEELKSLLDFYKTLNEVLSIIDFDLLDKKEETPSEIMQKFENRNNAKKEKNFELADSLRDELLELGYKIVDSREGSRVEKI